MLELLLALAVGTLGGWLAMKAKLPAGAMIGAMIATALFSVLCGGAYMPREAKIITQIIAGAFIGCSIRKEDILALRRQIVPAAVMCVCVLGFGFTMGVVLAKITGLDPTTVLFATAPGGLMEMTLAGADVGADSASVALLQTCRLFSVILLFPQMTRLVSGKVKNGREVTPEMQDAPKRTKPVLSKEQKRRYLLLTFAVAAPGGLIGYFLGIPAGTIVFAMAATAVFSTITQKAYMPMGFKRAAQVLSGTMIGLSITAEDVAGFGRLALPAVCIVAGFMLMNILLGFLMRRLARVNMATAMLAATPGGVSDISLIAGDLGADPPKVLLFQLMRNICVLAFYPVAVKLLLPLIF